VHLVGEDRSINLEKSEIFLLEKSQIERSSYRKEQLVNYAMSEHLVNKLFDIEPRVEALPASFLSAAQRVIQPERE
jgi:hypothetical protein